jgi:hypothetical protein
VSHLAERRDDFLFLSETVAAANQKSLDLLRAVEATVTTLGLRERFLREFGIELSRQAERLRTGPRTKVVDPEGEVTASLQRAEAVVNALRDELLIKCEAAAADPRLDDDDRSCLEDGFRSAIDAAADLHNALVDARWTIGEHDADLQRGDRSVLLSSREDIDAFLSSL